MTTRYPCCTPRRASCAPMFPAPMRPIVEMFWTAMAAVNRPVSEVCPCSAACQAACMRRTVSAAMDLDVSSASDLVLAVAATPLPGLTIEERLVVELDGAPLGLEELTEATGTRLHLAHAGIGTVTIRYEAA